MTKIYILIVTLLSILSCTSAKINSKYDLQGDWVSRFDTPVYPEFSKPIYYQFTFRNDSFFVEIGALDEDIDISYQPFKSKGVYQIYGDRIILTGVAKAEGSTKFIMNYRESFDYDYNKNYLKLFSNNSWFLTHYDMVRKSPVTK